MVKIKKNGNKIVKNRNKIGTIGNVGEKNISKMRKTQSQGGKGTGRRAGVLRSHVFFSFFSYFISVSQHPGFLCFSHVYPISGHLRSD